MATKEEVERLKDGNRMLMAALNRSMKDKLDLTARIKDNSDEAEAAKAIADGLEWQVEELQAENAKLRELVEDMLRAWWACDDESCVHHCECDAGEEMPVHGCLLKQRAKELGIEVE